MIFDIFMSFIPLIMPVFMSNEPHCTIFAKFSANMLISIITMWLVDIIFLFFDRMLFHFLFDLKAYKFWDR